MLNPLNEDDVIDELGPIAPIVLREAMDTGVDLFRQSRELDPVGHVDYSASTRANMLVDRMYPVMAAIVDVADPQGLQLATRRTHNQRALELFVGPHLYGKIKRIKDRELPAEASDDPEFVDLVDPTVVIYGMPQNIPTQRVLRQRSPQNSIGAQLTLDGIPPVQVPGDEHYRICFVAGFDWDVTEDQLVRHRIGLYDQRRAIWTRPLPVLSLDVIATISSPLAEQVEALRQARAS